MIFQRYIAGRTHLLACAAALFVCGCGEKAAETAPTSDEKRFRSTVVLPTPVASGEVRVVYSDAQRKSAKSQAAGLLKEMRRAERLSHDLQIMHNKTRYYREFYNPLENLLRDWPGAHNKDQPLFAELEDCATAGHKILAVGKGVKRHEFQKKHLTRERNAYLELMEKCERAIVSFQ